MFLALTFAFAVVPTFLLLGYFRARDLNPEPAKMLWATFVLGVLICFPVLPFEWASGWILSPLSPSPYFHGFFDALFGAAMPEEFFKFLVVALFCARSKEFDEPMDGIVYGAVASLGFASLENIGYVFGEGGGMGIAALRALTAVPGHAFMGAIMGYFIGQARFGLPAARMGNWIKAYWAPVALHTFYDFPGLTFDALGKLHRKSTTLDAVVALPLILITLAVLLLEWWITVRLVRRLRTAQIDEFKQAAASAAAAGGATDVIAALNRPEPPPKAGPGWIMAVLGGFIAVAGGFFCLLIILALLTSPMSADDVVKVMMGTALLGGVPLILGFVLFVIGVRRVHAANRKALQPFAAQAMAASPSI